MKVVATSIGLEEVRRLAGEQASDMAKAVVDIKRRVLGIGGDLHSDLEALLLGEGSAQADLWGINLYPDSSPDEFVQFDSLINLRPAQGNRSRGVEDPDIRRVILTVVAERVAR